MNNLVKISDIFEIKYGVNLELINLEQCYSTDPDSIPFISRTEKNNGVSAFVYKLIGLEPNPAHTLSVASGGSVLSTFYQPIPYYSGRDLYVLSPKREMSEIEMLFYAKCISSNKYKYNYGRQANKTLKDILVPKSLPEKLNRALSSYDINIRSKFRKEPLVNNQMSLNIDNWEYFKIADVFHLEKCKCSNASLLNEGDDISYIGAKKNNNGVMQKVEYEYGLISTGNCIVFIGDGQGSVGYSTYQPIDFIGSTTLTCGYNKNLNKYNAMFLVTMLDFEKFKYSFGRKYGKNQLEKAMIKLPSKNGEPDFEFMENYIKSLPYSKNLDL